MEGGIRCILLNKRVGAHKITILSVVYQLNVVRDVMMRTGSNIIEYESLLIGGPLKNLSTGLEPIEVDMVPT